MHILIFLYKNTDKSEINPESLSNSKIYFKIHIILIFLLDYLYLFL